MYEGAGDEFLSHAAHHDSRSLEATGTPESIPAMPYERGSVYTRGFYRIGARQITLISTEQYSYGYGNAARQKDRNGGGGGRRAGDIETVGPENALSKKIKKKRGKKNGP